MSRPSGQPATVLRVLHEMTETYWQELLETRRRLNLTQRQFAAYYGFPVATLRHWERGNRRPTGTALTLLFVIRENPGAVMRAVQKARTSFPGCLPTIESLRSYRAPPGFGEPRIPLRRARRRRKVARESW